MAAVTKIGNSDDLAGKYRSRIDNAVVSGTSGYLFCRLHEMYWCGHVETVMKIGADSKPIFEDLTYLNSSGYYIGVPILPSRGIFADVWLEWWETDILRAFLASPVEASTNKSSGIAGEFLGFVNPGEGRFVIRQMVLQVFAEDYEGVDSPRGKCKDPRHGMFIQQKLERAFRGDITAKVAHGWYMRYFSKCLWCFEKFGPSNDFEPDLVPGM